MGRAGSPACWVFSLSEMGIRQGGVQWGLEGAWAHWLQRGGERTSQAWGGVSDTAWGSQ